MRFTFDGSSFVAGAILTAIHYSWDWLAWWAILLGYIFSFSLFFSRLKE